MYPWVVVQSASFAGGGDVVGAAAATVGGEEEEEAGGAAYLYLLSGVASPSQTYLPAEQTKANTLGGWLGGCWGGTSTLSVIGMSTKKEQCFPLNTFWFIFRLKCIDFDLFSFITHEPITAPPSVC